MAPEPAPAAAEPPGVIADVLAQTRKLFVRYEPIKQLKLHEPVTFRMAVEALGEGSAKPEFGGNETVAAQAAISQHIRARLEGPPSVTIQARGDADQWVTNAANPTWTWDITANGAEPALLTMTVTSFVQIDGQVHEAPIDVYSAKIPVLLSPTDRIKSMIEDIDPIWKWIIGVGTVLAGVVAWVLKLPAQIRDAFRPKAAKGQDAA